MKKKIECHTLRMAGESLWLRRASVHDGYSGMGVGKVEWMGWGWGKVDKILKAVVV